MTGVSASVRAGLASCDLFRDLIEDPEVLGCLEAACEVRRVPTGSVIVEEGTEGDAMFVIVAGRVRVDKRTPHGDAFAVTFLSPEEGGFFGELALLERERRSASVVAETDCELVVIDRDRFLACGDRYPAAGLCATRRIAQSLSRRLRQSNDDVVKLYTALVAEIEQRL